MTITGSISAQELLALFRARFPDVEGIALIANAEVIATNNPEAAGVLARILSDSKSHEGAYYSIRLIRGVLIAAGSTYDGEDSTPWSAEDMDANAYISAFWSLSLCAELARMHAFSNTAYDLNMGLSDLLVSEATTSLFHDRLLKKFRTENVELSEWYWRGIALLHVYIRDEAKRDALTPIAAKNFVWWVGEQEDFKAAADFFMERQSIDAQQLDALSMERKTLAAPLRKGSL